MRTKNLQPCAPTARETILNENRRLRAEADDLRRRLQAAEDARAALARRLELSLAHKRFRYDALSFMLAHPDVEETVSFIAEHLLALSGCDRISANIADGRCRTWTRQGASYPDCACFSRCPTCPLAPAGLDTPDLLIVPDVRQPPGAPFPEACLAKSVVSLLVSAEGTPWCRLTLHYIDHPHAADEYELRSLKLGADVIATALERHRLVAAQEAETALRVRALDKAPISAYIKDADNGFRYVFMNDFTLAQLGLRRGDVIGRTDFDILPRATAAAYRRNDEEAAASDESLSRQEAYRDCAGRERQVQSFRCSARDANGHRLVIGYSLDLTELLEKQARIEALQNVAERERDHAIAAERAKSDFFASVSHDIRTPLNAIIGFSELLQNETDAALRRDYLDNIAFSGNTLLELVNDVLDLAKLDAGQMVFSREPFDLKRQVRLILRTFESAAREKRLLLRAELGDLPIVELDEQRTRQILFNLVGNAVKYTDAGGVTVSASFEPSAPDRGALRLDVRDTGIGIAPEDVARLMTPYVRLRAANARGGTGLGLSICKRIVEGMGGTLSLSSEPGKGSVFTVLFPDVRSRDDASAAAPAQAAPPIAGADIAALRVLVVDDLEMNRRVLEAGCRRLGAGRVASAASSEDALEQLRREPFDLVLTDMKMPGMDGRAFLQAIRSDPSFAGIAVFLVTADVEARKYYRDLGADGVLLKPIVHARLAEALSSVRLPSGCGEHDTPAGDPSAATP